MSRKRIDGTQITELDGFHSIVPYVMPKRTEAEVSSFETFDVTELCDYIRRRNGAEGTHLKLFHAICTAAARTIYLRPKIKIFIAGRRFWQRKDITLSFVAKQKFEDTAEEVLMFLKVEPEMTLDDISKIILGDVKKARQQHGNDLDKTMNFVGHLPRFVLEILFAVLRRFEYHGIMPQSLSQGDPNYSTALLSNLGSIGAGAPYHHLSNYGTCSVVITIGTDIESVESKTRKLDTGVDAEDWIVVRYKNGVTVNIHQRMDTPREESEQHAVIIGTKGVIKVQMIANPKKVEVCDLDGNVVKTFEASEQIRFRGMPPVSGYEHEWIGYEKALREGKRECEEGTHAMSLAMSHVISAVHKNAGIEFPF